MTQTLRSALLALPAAALVATAPGLAISAVPSLPAAALVQPEAAAGAPVLMARRGADDGAGHDVGDDKGGQRKDRKSGKKKKRGGTDDAPNHG